MQLLHSSIVIAALAAAQHIPKYGSQQKQRSSAAGFARHTGTTRKEHEMAYVAVSNISVMDRVRAALAELNDRAARAKVYRTTVQELNNLSGRELADLGIHRAEIKRIAYEAAYTN